MNVGADLLYLMDFSTPRSYLTPPCDYFIFFSVRPLLLCFPIFSYKTPYKTLMDLIGPGAKIYLNHKHILIAWWG